MPSFQRLDAYRRAIEFLAERREEGLQLLGGGDVDDVGAIAPSKGDVHVHVAVAVNDYVNVNDYVGCSGGPQDRDHSAGAATGCCGAVDGGL